MSVDDIKDLVIDEVVKIRQIKGYREGKVKGIDVWAGQVRVFISKNHCRWYAARMVNQLKNEN